MKHAFLLLSLITLFASCETKTHVAGDIDNLKSERTQLQAQTVKLSADIQMQSAAISSQTEQLKVLGILKEGKTPKYVLTLHLRQISYSLSISKQVRDAVNAIDFQISVDKDYYNSVSIGQNIVDNFRVGSLIMHGSFGNWEMQVKSKNIE